jgi:U3 small nucleolar ribonucleoprotein protein LCP5
MEDFLQTDLTTFSTICKEITDNINADQPKLLELKERLNRLYEEFPDKKGENSFQYLDVKAVLLLSYNIYLNYYMLCKVNGADLDQHEVFEKLSYLRLIIEKLKPLDKKIEYQVDKLLRAAVTINQGTEVLKNRQREDNLRYKPNLSNFDTKRVTDKVQADHSQKSTEKKERHNIDPENINSDDIDSEELEKYTVAKQKAQAKLRPQKEEESEKEDAEIYKAVKINPVSMIDKKSKSQK